MIDSLGKDHVQINSITVIPGTQKQQEFCMADIEELEQSVKDEDLNEDTNDEASVNSLMVNKIPMGKVGSPYEVIHVQTETGMFPVVIIYDTGSEVSLCNYETGPLIVKTKKADKKVTISIINSIQAKHRKVHKVKVKDDWSMEAIMIPKMKLCLQALDIPEVWQKLEGVSAEQDTYGVSAQILLGADQARFFPHKTRDKQGSYCKLIMLVSCKVKLQEKTSSLGPVAHTRDRRLKMKPGWKRIKSKLQAWLKRIDLTWMSLLWFVVHLFYHKQPILTKGKHCNPNHQILSHFFLVINKQTSCQSFQTSTK